MDRHASTYTAGERLHLKLSYPAHFPVPVGGPTDLVGSFLYYEEVHDYWHIQWEAEDRHIWVFGGWIDSVDVLDPVVAP